LLGTFFDFDIKELFLVFIWPSAVFFEMDIGRGNGHLHVVSHRGARGSASTVNKKLKDNDKPFVPNIISEHAVAE